MHTNGDYIELSEVSEETRRYYESLVGHTPFSFFKNLSSNIQIFDYYENYATVLLKGFCEAINQEFKTTYEYMVNPTINAGCMLEGDTNRIIVYEGVVFSLYNYAHKLVAYYKTIQMKTQKDTVDGHTLVVQQIRDGLKLTSEITLSERIEDNIIAEYIAMLAVKFIIAHEIGHILNGHLLYRNARGETAIEFNMTDSGSSDLSTISLQCMEIDADSFAVCEMVSTIEKELLCDEKLLTIVQSKDEIYKLAGCAVQCVFYLIGKLQNTLEMSTPEQYTHPPAKTRVNLLLDVCRGVISDDNKWGNIMKGCVIAERNLNDYFGVGNQSIDKYVLQILGTDDYGESLLESWRILKKELSQFTNLPFI